MKNTGLVALEAERNLLSSLIQNPLALDSLPDLSGMDFYPQDHKLLVGAILELRNRQIKVDRVTLNEQINKTCTAIKKERPESLTQEWINEICDDQVPLGIHEDYYRLLKEKTTLRSVVSFCERTSKGAVEFGIGDDLATFLGNVEASVMRFRQMAEGTPTLKDGREVLRQTAESFRESLTSTKVISRGLQTGIVEIDNHLVGVQPGEVTIIAARPSDGKTALMMAIALHSVLVLKKPTGVFSLEMTAEALMERAASTISGISTLAVKRSQVSREEREIWFRAYETIPKDLLIIDDTAGLTIEDIRTRGRRMVQEYGIESFHVDYLQKIRDAKGGGEKFMSKDERVGLISGGVKDMAKELGIPAFLLAQLNRELEKRTGPDKKPRLSDLRDSGNIEQDADNVWGIYRSGGKDNYAFDIISLKGRNTGIFRDVELIFDMDTQRLSPLVQPQPELPL
jgi:replicative DNA helicase